MGVGENLILDYGRSPSCERSYDAKPTSKGKRMSMIGAMNKTGIQAAINIEGTTNAAIFSYYIKNHLCPILMKNDYVVIDNASIHKDDEIRKMIEEKGAKLIFLPPYHPELNPIELAWNKIRQFIKKQRARTKEMLYVAYNEALNTITESNSKCFFEKAATFLN